MPRPRKSTPSRARSNSVTSVTSGTSSRAPAASGGRKSTGAAAAAAKSSSGSTPSGSSKKSTKSKKQGEEEVDGKNEDEEEEEDDVQEGERVPKLPEERNPVLPDVDMPVKLQVIQRESNTDSANNAAASVARDIVIGRVKLPTVNGSTHGFLLKRFDTNAIAVSSMYKLAFPYATPDEEAAEMAALEKKYDTRCANGGLKTDYVIINPVNDDGTPGKRGRGRPRKELRTFLPDGSTGVILQGTWVPAKNAHRIAKEYGLARYAQPLIDAQAAQFDRKPYFVDKNGAPYAAANGSQLQPHQIEDLLAGKACPPSNRDAAGKASSEASASAPLVNGAAAAAAATGATPAGKRARMESKLETDGSGQKRVSTTATSVVTNADGSTTLHTTKHTAEVSGKTAAEIDEDIAKSKEIAKRAQEEALTQVSDNSKAGKKRRAQGAPSAEIDTMADDDDYYASQGRNVLTRTIRRGTTVVRRRPVATSATAVAAVGVAGAAAAAFFNPASLDLALQAVQAGVANLQGWFF